MKKNKERVVVTGGLGFIGRNLVKSLLEKGYEVVIIDINGNLDSVPPETTVWSGSVIDLEFLQEKMKDTKYVFHLAALPRVGFSFKNPQATFETNVLGTQTVLQAARTCGVEKVIFASSSSVYGDQDTMPLSEDMTPNPQSPYAFQKFMGEELCRNYSNWYKLKTVSLRFFNVYGDGMDSTGEDALVIAKFTELLKKGITELPVTGNGNQSRDFTHVSDVVEGLRLAASSRVHNGEAINLGYGSNTTINELVRLIGGTPVYIDKRIEPNKTLANIEKAYRLFGWKPKVSIEEGLKPFI
ncbi:MAG: UDP-glucose 4-epimerase [Candidatus Paceibacteria bacterium]|jgi:UDP-glucose 4-epimerase